MCLTKGKYIYFSYQKKTNIDIFLSACKDIKVKTHLKYDKIEQLDEDNWMEMLQTLQSLAKKTQTRRQDSSGNFDSFKLDGTAVKQMIAKAKIPSIESDDASQENYGIYGSVYEDPMARGSRVSMLLSVTNIFI